MSRGRSPRREAASVVQPSTVTPGTPPPSLFPLWDALDNEAKTSCSPYDEKFLKSDYSLPHTFRESTGGTRSLDPNKMDPPPSRFAATTDRKKNFGLVSEWWKMGAKQQKAELFRYVNFPYQNKMRFMHNVDRLIIEQLSLFYTLTKQRTKFDELQSSQRKRHRSVASVRVLPILPSENSSQQHTTTDRDGQARHVSFDNNSDDVEMDDGYSSEDEDKSNSEDEDEDEDELDVLLNARDHHIGGYFVASDQYERTTTINMSNSLAPPVSKHIASSLVLAKYNQVLDTHVKFVETAPLGNEGLDNTNDFLIVSCRNVAYTKQGDGLGDTKIHPLPGNEMQVQVFGRSEQHANRLLGHISKAIASQKKPEQYQAKYPVNYNLQYVCGNESQSLKDSVQAHKADIENQRKAN